MKDPYGILGLTPDASEESLTTRYEELRNQYFEARFIPGEPGAEAAEKLSELEEAWEQIKQDLARKTHEERFGGDFGYIESLIRESKLSDAQNELDAMSTRTAEWHYYQSNVFYKRDWLSDAKTQLEMAVNLDPYNPKYRTALDRMRMNEGNPNIPPNQLGNMPPPAANPAPERGCGNDCSTCCFAYLCTDCLCNMSRCC
jgi:molecular chaperone DnaJ